MKILDGVISLILMLNFWESKGNDLLIVSTEVDNILANEPRDSFLNPFSHLSALEQSYICFRVNSAKLVVSFNTDNSIYKKNNHYISQLIHYDKYSPIVGNTLKNYDGHFAIPTLSCESSQSLIRITMNNKSKILYAFLKKPNDLHEVNAIFTTYFTIGQIKEYASGLLRESSNIGAMINLKRIIFCASLFEQLSPGEMDKKLKYSVKSSFSIIPSLPLPPFVRQKYRRMTNDLMCDGFDYNGHAIGLRFTIYFVSLYSSQDEVSEMKKLLVVSHDGKFTVMYDTMR